MLIEILNKKIDNLVKKDDTYVASFECSKLETFLEFYEQLREKHFLPNYCGRNWDAVDECIQDLEWIQERNVIIIFYGTNNLFLREPYKEREVSYFHEIFEAAIDFWRKNGEKSLRVIMCV